jgi:hypothetical protein
LSNPRDKKVEGNRKCREDNRHPWNSRASPSVGQLSTSKGGSAVRRPLSTCTLSLDCPGRPIIPRGTVALSQALSGIAECPSARWRRCERTHQESPRSCLYVPRCNVCPDPPSRPSNYRPVHQELHVRVLSGDKGCWCKPADRDDALRVSKIGEVRGAEQSWLPL